MPKIKISLIFIILFFWGLGLIERIEAATILSENFDSTCPQGQSCTIPPPPSWATDNGFWNLGRTQCGNIYRGSGYYAASAYQLDFYSTPSMLVTKDLSMSTSGNYTLTFWVRNVGSCAGGGNKTGLKIYRNTSQLVRGTQIGSTFTLTSTTWSQKTINFTVPSNGTYYIQFDQLSGGGTNDYIVIDDVIVNETITNNPPTISAVSVPPDPIEEQTTQTITPTGQGDPDSNPLHIYCCQDTTNTCTPTTANICNNDQAWSSPYSTMTCTLTTPDVTAATTYYARCRLYDGTAYSASTVSTSYLVKQKNGDTCSPNGSNSNCMSGNCADGYCCNSSCTGTCQTCAAIPGTCTTRTANDNTECSTCYRCDGSSTSCQIAASGQEGKDCTTACKQCDGSGNCIDINNAEDTVGTTCSGVCKYCSSGVCTTVTCAEEGYGTICSGSNVCNNAGTCVTKTANGGSCTVGTCTACSPSSSCIFCASGYCLSGGTCGLAGQLPIISSVSDSPDPQQGNSNVTFSSTASDPDAGDTIKLYICKNSSCSACGPSDTSNCWAVTATGVTSNPTAIYTCPSCIYTADNYWAKVCDQTGICSQIRPSDTGSFTCKKQPSAACQSTDNNECYNPSSPSSPGFAVDGYCCNSACSGNCNRCNITGSLGTCTNVNSECTGNCDVCSGGNCAASASLCTGDCDICSLVSETVFNCEANQNLCSTCSDCSGLETSFNCEALNNTEDTTGTTCVGVCKYCSSGNCINVTCAQETIGTTCSGSYVCDNNNPANCIDKVAEGSSCTVGSCTACLPSRSCIFCQSSYCGPNSTCTLPYYLYDWSWSENIGWISFSGSNYKVNLIPIASNTYKLEGYAWSENIGWISFNRSETGEPPDNDPCGDEACIAKLDTSTSPPQLFGWGRALAACETIPCPVVGACSNCGGWDGWVKLREKPIDPNYQVWLDTNPTPNELRDWAWSDMVLGWQSFNRANCDADKNELSDGTPAGCPSAGTPISNYKVMANLVFNQPPSKSTSLEEGWNHCSFEGVSKVTLSWQYSDSDGNPQDSYQVVIDNDSDFSSPEIDSCNPALSGGVNTCQPFNGSWSYTPLPNLAWDAHYYWKVKVKDNQGNWSEYSDTKSFDTLDHAYPWAEFDWSPPSPQKEVIITFNSQSHFFGSQQNLRWDFNNDGLDDSTSSNPTWFYSDTGRYPVKLIVEDELGSCQITHDVHVISPVPKWKEIPPQTFKWLKNLLADIFDSVKMVLFSKL